MSLKEETKLSFLIADDHFIIRQGLELIVKNFSFNPLVHFAGSLDGILKILDEITVDVLILDVNFPDGCSLNIMPEIMEKRPDLKVLVYTAYDEDFYALRFVKAGAAGYINKLSSESEVKEAINDILLKGSYLSSNIKEQIVEYYRTNKPINPFDKLSSREKEVAELYVIGLNNSEIAAKLKMKQNTISTYKSRIYEKLNINNLTKLIELYKIYNE